VPSTKLNGFLSVRPGEYNFSRRFVGSRLKTDRFFHMGGGSGGGQLGDRRYRRRGRPGPACCAKIFSAAQIRVLLRTKPLYYVFFMPTDGMDVDWREMLGGACFYRFQGSTGG
jgi:hypothetical protein